MVFYLRNWVAVQAVAACSSPEEAARLGRGTERRQPQLVRPDWPQAKVEVMLTALRAKFAAHAGPRHMLLSTAAGRAADAPLQVCRCGQTSSHDVAAAMQCFAQRLSSPWVVELVCVCHALQL